MNRIKAPFTEEQVKKFNDAQENGSFHGYTCMSPENLIDHCQRIKRTMDIINDSDVIGGNDGTLVATKDGLVCPCGKYKQNWFFEFTIDC